MSNNKLSDESIKPDPALIAAARAAYLDPVGQEFWAEVRERMATRRGEQPEPVEVVPSPRRRE